MQYGLIGEHLPHSFSKIIHEQIGLYEYELHEVEKDKLDDFMTKKEFKGINVTIPYKQAVIPYLDEISDRAKRIGAVNTIVNRGGRLFGDNTDFGGMQALIEKMGLDLAGKKVLILGTGGTSKTAYAVASELGAGEILKVSRSGTDGALTYEEVYEGHTDARIIINTTPCGMFPKADAQPLELSGFKCLEGVVDAIYNPLSSMLVQQAERLGAKGSGGLYMLVSQAVIASGIFTGRKTDPALTEKIYEELLKEKRNIVLIGMPGSGKSTVGRLLSERTGCEMKDSDEELTRQTGRTPAHIIREDGEPVFRKAESDVIKRLSSGNGMIISTGGGAVLDEKNVRLLKTNGITVFLDRDPSVIRPTKNRPLSDDGQKLKKLYEFRYPIYCKAADLRIENNGTAEEAAERICEFLKI